MGELILQIRRELRDPATDLSVADFLGCRLNDGFTNSTYHADLTDPLPQVFERYNWVPPWTAERTHA
jgi:hypothetical protein